MSSEKCYVVLYSWGYSYNNVSVEGVFKNREDAELFVAKHEETGNCSIEESNFKDNP